MMNTLRPRSAACLPTVDSLLGSTATFRASILAESNSRPHLLQRASRQVDAYTTGVSREPRTLAIARRIATAESSRTQTLSRSSLSVAHKPSSHLQNVTTRRSSHSKPAPVIQEPTIHDIFEENTGTWQYILADPATMSAVIIDPVLDYSRETQTVTTKAADSLLFLIMFWGYKVEMILETHAHADHLTAASYLQSRLTLQQGGLKPLIGIGKRIGQVQKMFGGRYGVSKEEYDGVFDKLFDDDETFEIGTLKAKAIHLPGHTPDHMGYQIGNNVFCGDSIFQADIGTARCDFPGGSSTDLFNSGRKLLALPDDVKFWTGHDYPPKGRKAPGAWMTVRQHKQRNKHLKDGTTREEFVAMRDERDATLGQPKLLHPSLQMNIRAGRLPRPTSAGKSMLHLPLKVEGVEW